MKNYANTILFDGPDQPQPVAVSWNGRIRWALTGPSVFDDGQEELEAVFSRPNQLSTTESVSDLWIFQYGLRYMPPNGASNVYRTIKIDNLPASVTLNQVLAQLRPFEVYSARLMDTTRMIGSNTAIIVFVYQGQVLSLFHGISQSGLLIGNHRAEATLVETPTYPIPARLQKLIYEHGYTRSLAVCNLRESLTMELRRVLLKSICRDYVECFEDGYVAGEVIVRFHSVGMASHACELLQKHPCFANCELKFLRPSGITGTH